MFLLYPNGSSRFLAGKLTLVSGRPIIVGMMKTTTQHTYSNQPAPKKVALRREAMDAWRSGRSISAIARDLGVSRQCLYNWIEAWQREGDAGLAHRRRGPAPALEPQAQEELGAILKASPREVGLDADRWTLELATEFVAQRWDVHYAPRSLFHVLKRIGALPLRKSRRPPARSPRAWRGSTVSH